jgi:ATPase subunit of ABC transporter with duplicated ATPase domains
LLVMEGGGRCTLLPGSYSDYVRRQEEAAAERAAEQARAEQSARTKRGKTAPKKPGAGKPARTGARLKQLEAAITEREEQLADLQQAFADPQVYRDPERIRQLRALHDGLKAELEELNAAWHKLAGP